MDNLLVKQLVKVPHRLDGLEEYLHPQIYQHHVPHRLDGLEGDVSTYKSSEQVPHRLDGLEDASESPKACV